MLGNAKEYDLSLLQRDPAREQLLSKMRGKLAATPASSAVAGPGADGTKRAGRTQGWTWAVRVAMVALIASINWLLIERKDAILGSMGLQGIPTLPKASSTLTPDEKALYYAYALFDYGKFQERFGKAEYYAVDPVDARRRLQDLMPKISTSTLGEISGYMPVAFKAIPVGGLR